jgi:hypothetical protein
MTDNLIDVLPQIVSIFGLAFFYFWPAIPAGLALGLPPLVVVLTTSLSYACGVALVTLLGERVRDWALRRLGRAAALNPESLVGRTWGRFGVIGLGLAAPMTIGSQAGAALGIALGAPSRRLFLWMGVGALAWSILLTVLVLLGVVGAQAVMQ